MDPVGASAFGARFDIVGEAGSGGMGKVYEAIDRQTTEKVAIKVLSSSGDRERFAREVEILEALEHEAIVKHVGHGDTATGHPFLAMQWLAGETLSKRLRREPLAILESLELGSRLADALAHAHAAGVTHRDLKPSNVYLVDGAVTRACLIDFGIAKLASGDLTTTGQMIGTPGYMAPEQVRGEKSVDHRVDVFALACVLYEAIGGRPAFGGGEVMETLSRLLLERPPPLADTPLRLGWLLEAMFVKDAAHRLADCAIVRDELDAIAVALRTGDEHALVTRSPAIPVPPPESPTSNRPTFALPAPPPTESDTTRSSPTRVETPSAKRAEPKRRLGLWIAITVLAAIGGGVAGAYLVLRSTEDVPPPPVTAVTTPEPAKPATATKCDDLNRTGCKAECEGGDPGACWLQGLALIASDSSSAGDAALVAFERSCELGGVFGCAEAAEILLDNMPEAKDIAAAKKHLERGCEGGDTYACLLDGEQARPHGHWPDVARSFRVVGSVCDDRYDEEFRGDGCALLRTMIVSGEGSHAQRQRAARLIEGACKRGVDKACPRN